MSWIVALAGYNPEKEGRKPRKRTKEKRREALPSYLDRPDVRINPVTKKPEQHVDVGNGQHEWQPLEAKTDYGLRTAVLTPAEREFFETTKKYSPDTAERLKTLWAAGMGPTEASRQFRGERGFSLDNIKRYYKEFKRHLEASPAADDGGGVPPKGG